MSSFGGTVKLTGESEYQKALKDISGNLKMLGSEMKLTTSLYDKNDTSVENLSSQNKILTQKIEEQEKKVSVLNKALAQSKEETGENSATTKKWQLQLNEAQAELNKLNKDLETNEKVMQDEYQALMSGSKAVEDFGEEAEKSGSKALSLGDIIKANLISDAIMSGLSALGGAIKGVGEKFSAFLELGESTKEMQAQTAQLASAFGDTEVGAEMATESVYALAGVLGDTGKATEASVLLAKMSKDSKDLDANTRILTGVFAEFGESIPTEGLAEGMQATAEMGSVQGVLADALEWQGVNLDDYNAKLETMSSAEERASYIQKTLTDLYGESADAYRKNNEALIESNEAQLRYEQHLADMGKLAMPLQTDIKNMSTALMQGFMPALEGVMPSIQAVSGEFTNLIKAVTRGDEGGIQGATEMISQYIGELVVNLSNVLPQVAELVSSLVTTVVTVITDNLPYIVEEGMKLLSSLLSGIMQMLPSIIPTVMSVIEKLLTTILENLPMIIEMGMQMLTSLIQGIADMLPTLIPTVIDAVLLMVETILDNIDLIIDAGINVILALADGLLEALPRLIDKIPVIIDKLITAITNNLPKIIEMGITLTVQLAVGLIKAIPNLLKAIPQIISSMVNGFNNYYSKLGEVGLNLVQGLWNGIKDATGWVLDKIKGFGKSILNGIKSIFGIHSPSTLFRDEVGKNLALGVGEGFADTMADVSADMQNSIPTEFDADIGTNINIASGQSQMSTFDMMVSAFKQALTEVKVVMDDREMGTFVTDTVERVVYA